ncbi:DUF4190 domain-containing protein [Mycobacterium sp. ACS4331]|uniref:DUF4190 domain-containing protein n=1 Tax=Mycobacterium sp. ACS4331 TaxID=1834121 RepID=UPI0007FC5903|nr:DUF4190 domain-containing protein [Mycobacterium sp. ACS4331]OBF27448.1 hypothetical protein A5727_26305 [Mycobacterium sp. ACS4331]
MTAVDGDPGRNPHPDGWALTSAPPAGTSIPDPLHSGDAPAPRPGTNVLAVVSLVSSVAGLVPYLGGLPATVGIALGIVARDQIRRAPQRGYGLAVAGIVVGVATLIIGLIWTIYAMR